MAELKIHQFFCRSDNFGVLIHDDELRRQTAAIDTPDAEPIRRALDEKGWSLTHILTTHHHADHTAGHAALKSETGCRSSARIRRPTASPASTSASRKATVSSLGGHQLCVLETPGHTLGHVTYWLPDDNIAFVGDTLFSLGCGRLLEGDGAMMWQSLQKLMALPKETLIYCGHEYSKSNCRFCPQCRAEQCPRCRKGPRKYARCGTDGLPTLPVSLAAELAQNPFLRPDSPEIQERLGMVGHPLATIFSELRRLKDRF